LRTACVTTARRELNAAAAAQPFADELLAFDPGVTATASATMRITSP
jgi:hypothetical protein